jgi:hypothetical protein
VVVAAQIDPGTRRGKRRVLQLEGRKPVWIKRGHVEALLKEYGMAVRIVDRLDVRLQDYIDENIRPRSQIEDVAYFCATEIRYMKRVKPETEIGLCFDF